MRLLLLNQFYPPDTAATGQLLADVARVLVRDGHEVHVVCSRGGYAGGTVAGASRRDADGVRVHRVSASNRGRLRAADRLLAWGSYYALAAQRALALGRFDACLALTTPPFIGLVGSLLKRLRRTRLVLWSMDVWPDVAEGLGVIRPGSPPSRALHAAARAVHKSANRIISLGSCMTERLCRAGVDPARIATVHNWVPGESVRPVARRSANGRFLVMYSGNMGMGHEFGTMLDAAARLRDDRSVEFRFVGGGKRRAEVEAGAERRGLGNVRFMKPVPLRDLSELLGSADAHLLSMRPGLEGMLVPSKVYGILAAGRPAVMVGSTENEAARLIRRSGAGFVVPAGRAGELCSAIRRLRDEPELAPQMGRAGRRYYETRLGRDRSISAIVRELMGARVLPLILPSHSLRTVESGRKSA